MPDFDFYAIREMEADHEQINELGRALDAVTAERDALAEELRVMAIARDSLGEQLSRDVVYRSGLEKDNFDLAEQVKDLEAARRAYSNEVAGLAGQNRVLREALHLTIDALRLTREYVGADLLPALAGWSLYDATVVAQAALAQSPGGDHE